MNPDRQKYLAAAAQLGAHLCRDAIWWENRCNWLGSVMESVNGSWTVIERALGPDLYGGTSGIGLFLARLAEVTGEKLFRRTAIGALNQAWSKREDIVPKARLGFYSGWLGIAYSRIAAAESLGQADQRVRALELVQSLAEAKPDPLVLDVISGSAGAIPVLLELHHRLGKESLLDLALAHGEHLLRTARKREQGWSWKTLEMSMRDDLTGFSHGAAGIAWALLELYKKTSEARWRSAAEQAFLYERRWFDPQESNWADLRILDPTAAIQSPKPGCSMAWCHGAPGVALSRIRAWEILHDDSCRREAEAALATTAKALDAPGQAAVANYSLCHGQGGNAEALVYASQVLDPSYLRPAEATAERGLQFYYAPRAAWPCGVPGAGETPSLLLGLAGIGYFYLRMFNPQAFPSVLLVGPTASAKPLAETPQQPAKCKAGRKKKSTAAKV
jgi:lantibiotic biosynthesis protein